MFSVEVWRRLCLLVALCIKIALPNFIFQWKKGFKFELFTVHNYLIWRSVNATLFNLDAYPLGESVNTTYVFVDFYIKYNSCLALFIFLAPEGRGASIL